MSPQADLEERVERIELLIGKMILAAREHAVGRKILALLGIE